MNIYLESGYVDIKKILDFGLPFNFIVGGRGTGKTFGALEYVIRNKVKFIYMRRTQTQCDLINKPEFSPFKSLNQEFGWNIGSASVTKYNSAFYEMQEIEGKLKPSGSPLGYSCALSTVSNIRGFDASDVSLLIYDEFIPERHEKPIKHEASAFFNAYETINRNRELKGIKPLQVLCLANANDLGNPIFLELGMVQIAEKMRRREQIEYINREKGIGIFLLSDSLISEKKKETAIYKITKGTAFAEMATSNEFSLDESSNIKSMPLKEFRPIVGVGDLTIYEHKADRTVYVSTHRIGEPPIYTGGEIDRARFTRAYWWIWDLYLTNQLVFEDYFSEVLLRKYFE